MSILLIPQITEGLRNNMKRTFETFKNLNFWSNMFLFQLQLRNHAECSEGTHPIKYCDWIYLQHVPVLLTNNNNNNKYNYEQ